MLVRFVQDTENGVYTERKATICMSNVWKDLDGRYMYYQRVISVGAAATLFDAVRHFCCVPSYPASGTEKIR